VAQPMLDELARLIERQTGADGAHQTAMAELTLTRFSAPSGPTVVLCEPLLCLVAQGSMHMLLAGEVYRYDSARILLVSVDLPVATQVIEASPRAPYLALRVALDPAIVGELVADGASLDTRNTAPARGVALSPVEPPLFDAVLRLVGFLESPRDIAALSPLVIRELTYRVLTGEQGPRLRQIASGGAPAQRIARAIRWLKHHFAEPLHIEALAREVRLSPSALHRYFKTVTAMSPLQYQKRLRLQEARRLMLGDGLDASEAGFRVGYESPSQFSREYSRLFGATLEGMWRRSGSCPSLYRSNRGRKRLLRVGLTVPRPRQQLGQEGRDVGLGRQIAGDQGRTD
jgi:AraC-like DNA-binding protein